MSLEPIYLLLYTATISVSGVLLVVSLAIAWWVAFDKNRNTGDKIIISFVGIALSLFATVIIYFWSTSDLLNIGDTGVITDVTISMFTMIFAMGFGKWLREPEEKK